MPVTGLKTRADLAPCRLRLGSCIGLPYSFVLLGCRGLIEPTHEGAAGAELAALAKIERRRGADRRHLTLRSFLKGGVTPRRRSGRRADEQHLPIDWHEPYLLFLSIMILLLSVADAFLTITLIMGGAQEANPLLAFVLARSSGAVRGREDGAHGRRCARARRRGACRLFRIMRVGVVLQGFFVAYVALIAYEWWLLRTFL